MAYIKRDWDNTSNEVTKEDFKRIEDGIETNDKQINVLSANTFMQPICQQYYKGAFITDWNLVIENGLYMQSNCIHSPMDDNTSWWMVSVKGHDTRYCVQDAYNFTDRSCERFTRTLYAGTWSDWIPTSEIHGTITFANGWSQFEGHQPCKVSRIGNRCFLSGLARKGLTDSGTTILTVPEFFRPKAVGHVITHDAYGFYMYQSGNLVLTWNRFENIDTWYALEGLSWEVE